MATRRYTIEIETPEAEDNFNYQARVTQDGVDIGLAAGCMVPMLEQLGEIIGFDLDRATWGKGLAKKPAPVDRHLLPGSVTTFRLVDGAVTPQRLAPVQGIRGHRTIGGKPLRDAGFDAGLAGHPCDAPTTRESDRAAWTQGWNAGHNEREAQRKEQVAAEAKRKGWAGRDNYD